MGRAVTHEATPPRGAGRALWLKRLHHWHWISSAVSMVALLAFSITGFTLNNASHFEAPPRIERGAIDLPAALRPALAAGVEPRIAPDLAQWLHDMLDIDALAATAEWSGEELYLEQPGPGKDAWVRIDRRRGAVEFERTDRGWLAYFNDLHKGRHTGAGWSWFIDVLAAGCVVFTLTGLAILQMHAANRPLTWPLTALGLVLPLLLMLLLIH